MNLINHKETDFKMEVADKNETSIFSVFACGNQKIDQYFRSGIFERDNICYAYMDIKLNKVVGLADICCSGINTIYNDKVVDILPTVKIDHFAISEDYQNILCPNMDPDDHFYLSDMFLCLLINQIRFISEHIIGATYIFVHSVPEAEHFYKRNLFENVEDFMGVESNRYINECIPMILTL